MFKFIGVVIVYSLALYGAFKLSQKQRRLVAEAHNHHTS